LIDGKTLKEAVLEQAASAVAVWKKTWYSEECGRGDKAGSAAGWR